MGIPKLTQFQIDPEAPGGFDYVVCEATFGDTDGPSVSPEYRRRLVRAELQQAIKRRGPLLIPSFAVERTQELLVDLVALMDLGEVSRVPIFIDTPLASALGRTRRASE